MGNAQPLESRRSGNARSSAAWMGRLAPVEPPETLRLRILHAYDRHAIQRARSGSGPAASLAAPPSRRRRALGWMAAAVAFVAVTTGLASFQRAAVRADATEGRERPLAVVDDPSLPLFHGIDSFDGLTAQGERAP